MTDTIKAVLDTNVLVSALLSPNGAPAKILAMIADKQIMLCIDSRILLEYEKVLSRDKFHFEPSDIAFLLNFFLQAANVIVPEPIKLDFSDKDDKKFYEAAKYAGAYLITGNAKHFPEEPFIQSPASFLEIVGRL
jgi:putative PIN family toxin of toxin-antitoxin system